jgi:hypothetical protein
MQHRRLPLCGGYFSVYELPGLLEFWFYERDLKRTANSFIIPYVKIKEKTIECHILVG